MISAWLYNEIDDAKHRNSTSLNLSGQNIDELPPEIGDLPNLEELDLTNNTLIELPNELVKLSKLKWLGLDGNPLISPPLPIINQGTEAVLLYLRETLDYRRQWSAKMIIVGEGGVGKTSLLRSLRGESFIGNLTTTHGLGVHTVELPHPNSVEIDETSNEPVTLKLNTWDFGGQEIYHATHQFFLTDRSLFLLVWNARHGYEQGRLYYWLDMIQSRAPKSPVLIVATHIDERDPDLPLLDLKAKYPQIIGLFPVDNQTRDGIDSLKESIGQQAIQLPLIGEKWPKNWLYAANTLRKSEEKFITAGKFKNLLEGFNVNEQSIEILTTWLHELGDILFFKNDAELDDLVILKPQWVSEYISKVLENDNVIKNQGVFTSKDANKIWGDLDPILHNLFLRLMERFDLSYRTLEDKEISLVVERLPQDPPNYQDTWIKQPLDENQHVIPIKDISIIYQLNTIPAGIPSWFIARSHRFTTHTHWRNGALFKYDQEKNTLALVTASPHERVMRLTVRGPSPVNFFALLRDGFDVTLRRYPGLEIDRYVPCPGHNGVPCSYRFKYDHLIKRLQQEPPRVFIECPEGLQEVDVRTLLFGLTPSTLDEVLYEVKKAREENVERYQDLITLVQREFTKSFRREQEAIDTDCPNVFVIRPHKASGFKNLMLGGKVELQLYCQAPGHWHPVVDGGSYTIDKPVDWLRKVAPYLRNMIQVLKYMTPFLGPWIGMADRAYKDLVDNDIKFMDELVKIMPELLDDEKKTDLTVSLTEFTESNKARGVTLRTLRQLLEKVDPDKKWGGLTKVLTPEDHYLWVCNFHYKQIMP